jgi:hypothetical protein
MSRIGKLRNIAASGLVVLAMGGCQGKNNVEMNAESQRHQSDNLSLDDQGEGFLNLIDQRIQRENYVDLIITDSHPPYCGQVSMEPKTISELRLDSGIQPYAIFTGKCLGGFQSGKLYLNGELIQDYSNLRNVSIPASGLPVFESALELDKLKLGKNVVSFEGVSKIGAVLKDSETLIVR